MKATSSELGAFGRHLVLVLLWFGVFRLLGEHAVRLLPKSVTDQLTLQSYLTGVQIATAAIGLALAFLLLNEAPRTLGLSLPKPSRLGLSALLAPALYVASSYAAIYAALPTLLEELERGGRQAVQQSTGEFGRELTQASVLSAVVWGVVVSPIGEELLFRGALWSLVDRAIQLVRSRRPVPSPVSDALPSGVISDGLGLRAARSIAGFFVTGGVATLVSAGVFAWMHADMPGGLGIVRWVSALGLGVCAGVARHLSGGVLAPIVVHVGFNLCSLATTRRWLLSESFPMKRGVPTLLSLMGAVLALVALGAWLVARVSARSRAD